MFRKSRATFSEHAPSNCLRPNARSALAPALAARSALLLPAAQHAPYVSNFLTHRVAGENLIDIAFVSDVGAGGLDLVVDFCTRRDRADRMAVPRLEPFRREQPTDE